MNFKYELLEYYSINIILDKRYTANISLTTVQLPTVNMVMIWTMAMIQRHAVVSLACSHLYLLPQVDVSQVVSVCYVEAGSSRHEAYRFLHLPV